MSDFEEFPKIARLSRRCVITEKIDGTNAQVFIHEGAGPADIRAGSRNRWLTAEQDNFGFAKWVEEHAGELIELGPGRHFGEWWGSGIQRKYGLGEKRFSLFNTARWGTERPSCCHVVPVLYEGLFHDEAVEDALRKLAGFGSFAAPGFMDPEGVVIWHEAARVLFKKTLVKDEEPKGKKAA